MRQIRILGVAVLVLWPACGDAADNASLENAVKATFLYKFAEFVQWPAGPAASGPLVLCAAGDDTVSALLDRVAAGQRVGERTVTVRHLEQVSPADGCEIAYLAGSAGQSADAAAAALHGSPVLTVTDGDSHPRVPAVIKFQVLDNRVRFDVDDAEAAADHLAISSRLLDLARNVRKRP